MDLQRIVGLISALLPIVSTVETIAKELPIMRGKSKEDAAVALLKETPQAAQALQDPQFESAVRTFIQAYVALQNAGKPAVK